MFALLSIACASVSHSSEPPLTEKEVINLLGATEPDPQISKRLIEEGRIHYSTYLILVNNKREDASIVSQTLIVLRNIKDDRSMFLDTTLQRLCDDSPMVRLAAVELLKEIGGEKESSPVVALLSDEKDLVVYQAGKTLQAIGGKRELLAFDIWLKTGSHKENKELRGKLKEYRDALEKRLKEKK